MRIIRIITLAAVAAMLTALPSSVRADEPSRSGTIVSGAGASPANPWVRGMEGCVGAPSCSAWLQSSCDPALAGLDPALHASIVDVADLAGTERVLDVRGAIVDGFPFNGGTHIVQFWTATAPNGWDACREIVASRITWRECGGGPGCAFRIPSKARWMTITSSTANTNIRWTLS